MGPWALRARGLFFILAAFFGSFFSLVNSALFSYVYQRAGPLSAGAVYGSG